MAEKKSKTAKVKAIELYTEGNQAYNSGEFENAFKKYDASIKLSSGDLGSFSGEAYAGRGLAKQKLKDKAGAKKDFVKAIELGYEPAVKYLKELSGNKETIKKEEVNTKPAEKKEKKTAKDFDTPLEATIRDILNLRDWEMPITALLWRIFVNLFWLFVLIVIITNVFHC